MKGRRVAAAAFVGCSLVSSARAEPAPVFTVSLTAPPCIGRPYDRARLVEMLRVEVRALGVTEVTARDPSADPEPAPLTLLASVTLSPSRCDAPADALLISVLDRASQKRVERRMTVEDLALSERPRAIAIAIGELLTGSLVELALTSAPAPALPLPPAMPAALATRVAPTAETLRTERDRELTARLAARDQKDTARAREEARAARAPGVSLAALGESFPSRATALLGADVAVRLRVTERALVEGGALAAFGGTALGVGSVSVGEIAGHVGVAYRAGDAVEMSVGPRLDVGYGFAKGSSDVPGVRASTYGNVVAVAMAAASLRIRSAPLSPLVSLAVGHTVADVSFLSDQARAAGLGGVAFAASVGGELGL